MDAETRELGKEQRERGFTVLELLVVMGIGGIMMAMAVSNMSMLSNPTVTSLNQIQGIIKLARSRAVATTSPYIVAPDGAFRVVGKRATACDDANPTTDPRVQYDLPNGMRLSNTTWSVCFTSRGIADSAIEIPVQDQHGVEKRLEVMRGGAVRIKPS